MTITSLPDPFDPSQWESSSFKPLPVGKYTVQITDASVDETRNGSGLRANFTLQVCEGDFENRYLWHGVTITNPSTQAVEIGRKQLKDLCVACDITDPIREVDVFKFKPFLAQVGIQIDKSGIYSDRNKITRVMPLTSAAADTRSTGERINDSIDY